MWKMEGLFAEAKSLHCMKRAKYRGLWKVQAQVYMIAFVQNLKRLVTLDPQFFINYFIKTFRTEILSFFYCKP
ncbi:MAG: transposase [Deltaproteobacteria bacterium]|nr:transposase [Deltaproteobacteria bacterium]